MNGFEFVVAVGVAANLGLVLVLLLRKGADAGGRLEALERASREEARALREEVGAAVQRLGLSVQQQISDAGARQQEAIQTVTAALRGVADSSLNAGASLRTEVAATLKERNDLMLTAMSKLAEFQRDHLKRVAEEVARLATAVDGKLEAIRGDNARQLEQMRQTVDEKLQGALERRLSESFQHVSQRLEEVHRGLGEMQALAVGVGDLKRVLTNVKSRGTWGEVQLGALLEHVLAPEQFEQNVATRSGSAERVEFAIRLPGHEEGRTVWLPVDAKFPQEDYLRLVEAQERGDPVMAEEASRQLAARVRACARDIHDRYLNPPATTDFGILFLPTEGLFAETIRRPGLVETIQRESRVMIAGPTTLAAMLNSLQMGFRTLAIQKRSSEVWEVLGKVKTEFIRFGETLDKVQKKLLSASTEMDRAATRTRQMERALRDVQALPAPEEDVIPPPDLLPPGGIPTDPAFR